jgi:DNA polymerase III subunit gamma/tau
MEYQVLARKWRPHTFAEMVGQTHVQRVLINALDSQRLHHAYLFTGTRGVGKTTIARIFAKSLNCETNGVSSQPCGHCMTCKEVDAGRFVDLIEVDAASRTKVDDTRELLENVQYSPTRGRFKVYLIDEVHMLSDSSFNALLKTLEEPPAHVKFLFATTDPQKLPITVLSRCLQFNLKRLPVEMIAEYLIKVLTLEKLPHETPALKLIAKAADGSMRDALSLLDQAIAYGAGKVGVEDVHNMLGTLDQGSVVELLKYLAQRDGAGLMAQVAHLAEYSPDYAQVLAELLAVLQHIAIAQVVPATLEENDPETAEIQMLCQHLTPEEVQLFYQIALLGRRDLAFMPDTRGGFEMILLRMLAFRPSELAQTTSSQSAQTTQPRQIPPSTPSPANSFSALRASLSASDPKKKLNPLD